MSMDLEYVPVDESHHRWLYELLKERDGTCNISHSSMPTWKEHVKFCRSDPYESRWVAKRDGVPVGTCYVTRKSEIGIFVKREFQGQGLGGDMLKWILDGHRGRKLYANINQGNDRSLSMFRNYGFSVCQETLVRQN